MAPRSALLIVAYFLMVVAARSGAGLDLRVMRAASPASCSSRTARAASPALRSSRAPRSAPLVVDYFLLQTVAALGGAGLGPHIRRAASASRRFARA
eukprot:3228883-Alexandrium_andersonii.AAC.1